MLFKNKNEIFFFLLFFIVFLLYSLVGFLSPGYDDEFFNVKLVEKLGFNTIKFVQSQDVHPPGSYFLNWIFYSITDNWKIVRFISGFFTAASIVYAVNFIRQSYGNTKAFLFLIFLGFNPAVLMWGTGVRWYSYFIPVLIYLLVVPRSNNRFYWVKLFIGLLVLGYLGYAVFIVAPSLFFLYWRNSNQLWKVKLRKIFFWAMVSLFFYLPQLKIFFTVHINGSDAQRSSLLKGLIGFVVAHVSNQGVFPLSLGGLATCLGTVGVILFSLKKDFKKIIVFNYMGSYFIGLFFLIISGLGGKFRNFVILSPLQALSLSTIIQNFKRDLWIKISFFFLLVGNMLGVYNVMSHTNTTKNSWNLPVDAVIRKLEKIKSDCSSEILVFVHDPLLAYSLEKKKYVIVSPFEKVNSSVYGLKSISRCVVIAKTFVGTFSDSKIRQMYSAVEGITRDINKETIYLGYDSYYSIKAMLDDRYPKYQVELLVFESKDFDDLINSWQPSSLK
jgi:hypothetical protein